jgi:hypothetical protein
MAHQELYLTQMHIYAVRQRPDAVQEGLQIQAEQRRWLTKRYDQQRRGQLS